MAAFEMWAYKVSYWDYKGQPVCMVPGTCYETDDREFADAASRQAFIEVIANKKPLGKMSKKELISEATAIKIKTSGLNKSELIEAIKEVRDNVKEKSC